MHGSLVCFVFPRKKLGLQENSQIKASPYFSPFLLSSTVKDMFFPLLSHVFPLFSPCFLSRALVFPLLPLVFPLLPLENTAHPTGFRTRSCIQSWAAALVKPPSHNHLLYNSDRVNSPWNSPSRRTTRDGRTDDERWEKPYVTLFLFIFQSCLKL